MATEKRQIPPKMLSLLKRSITHHHRSMFLLIGDDSRETVPVIYNVSKKLRPPSAKPNVLWCYKHDLGFASNRKKRLKQISKMRRAGLYGDANSEEATFDQFVASTNVRFCYYSETEKILGQTFGFLILQDFEALTPNLLARTIETVEGGGSVIFLLKSMDSLKRLYSLTMDVHVKFATANNKFVRPRFNERFILSLNSNPCCAVLDEELNLLPLTKLSAIDDQEEIEDDNLELQKYLKSLPSTNDGILIALTSLARTVDQAKSVAVFVEAVSSKTLSYTVTLTASRGRGKSAALGIALACAVAYGYSNIFLTAPSPDNLQTVFEFAERALTALKFVEHTDYELVSSSSSTEPVVRTERNQTFQREKHPTQPNRNITRINIFRTHRQTIQYIPPTETSALSQAEMLVVDEAAAIPLPIVKKLLGPYLVLLSSTIDGYEGTGRSLSLKLFDQLRVNEPKNRRTLTELTLETPIRYGKKDPIEKWLNDLLCLDAKVPPLVNGNPHPSSCKLFLVDRDTLFSKHKVTEELLRRIMALMVASHYKNTPNDLQLLSDAPAHRLFVLLGPTVEGSVPDVLCVAQIAFEGNIPGAMVREQLSQGNRSSGDMLPWTISQQYQEDSFAQLSGARVVRITTHPDTFSMGYGSRMLELLERYFKGEMIGDDETSGEFESMHDDIANSKTEKNENNDDDDDASEDNQLISESIKPRKKLNPLLVPAEDVPPPTVLDYLGVSFGLTPQLYKFWEKAGFLPLYIRQTENIITGEFSCIMLKPLGEDKFSGFSIDFSRRYSKLLGGAFRSEPTSLALAILSCGTLKTSLTSKDLIDSLTIHDRSRLEAYARNLVDHHLVTDLFPRLADLYFFSENRIHLSPLQQALLVGVGYQMKTIDQLSHEMNYPAQPLLANLQKMVRKFSKLEASTPATNGEEEQDQLEQAAKSVSALQPGTLVSIPADPSKVAAEKEEAKKKVRPSTSSKKDFSQRSKKHKREKA